jgi:hypothetical protein
MFVVNWLIVNRVCWFLELTSQNFQNIILVFCVLLHETGTILSTKRGISPIKKYNFRIKAGMCKWSIVCNNIIYDITGTENISFESSSFRVKSCHTHTYKQVLPNNSIFKLAMSEAFCTNSNYIETTVISCYVPPRQLIGNVLIN